MFKQILLCYDGTERGQRALRCGADLAVLLGARVRLLAIVPPGTGDPALMAAAMGTVCVADDPCGLSATVNELLEWLRTHGIEAEGHVVAGNAIDQILAHAARYSADLIVLSHYPQPSGGFWWSKQQQGSLAERANCCVLIVRDSVRQSTMGSLVGFV
jgi:nucleotide-binding universal stress UspA family protein